MSVDIPMRGKRLISLVKRERKTEWDVLYAVSKELTAARSAVSVTTIYFGATAGVRRVIRRGAGRLG